MNDTAALLGANAPSDDERIRSSAYETLIRYCGPQVYYRGLLEFSNICSCNCYYCGIRVGNTSVHRYELSDEEVLAGARWCADRGYGSLVLQSGERRDEQFVNRIESLVTGIKKETRSKRLPQGLGITLCVGEQSRQTYDRFFNAGAHRYLLRIETSSPELFARIHPPRQRLETRIQCLRELKAAGYQVGTGVMIGLPGQTIENLANDIRFFQDMDIDMIGMGPYIKHPETPMAAARGEYLLPKPPFEMALRMIAVTRLILKDVNIAATTALEALAPDGREQGLQHGANVLMPQLTPVEHRKDYLLYEGKPCTNEDPAKSCLAIEQRLAALGRPIVYNQWGDSPHATRKK
jgi:biotin synthase